MTNESSLALLENEEVTLYPSWKQALYDLEKNNISPGQIIEKKWLEKRFGITQPMTIADAEKNRLLFRTFIWHLRTDILRKHRLMLRSVDGVGYRVVEVEDQTRTAMRDRGETIKREVAKLMDEISFVRIEELDDAGRKANRDAIANVASLQGMVKRRLERVF